VWHFVKYALDRSGKIISFGAQSLRHCQCYLKLRIFLDGSHVTGHRVHSVIQDGNRDVMLHDFITVTSERYYSIVRC